MPVVASGHITPRQTIDMLQLITRADQAAAEQSGTSDDTRPYFRKAPVKIVVNRLRKYAGVV